MTFKQNNNEIIIMVDNQPEILNLVEDKNIKQSGRGKNQLGKVRGSYLSKGKNQKKNNQDNLNEKLAKLLVKIDKIALHLKIANWEFEIDEEEEHRQRQFRGELQNLLNKYKKKCEKVVDPKNLFEI